jgi:hypothetical protein
MHKQTPRTMPLSAMYKGPKDFLCSGRPTLLTTDLDASVCEYVDCLGFKVVQHIPHTAALLKRDGIRVQLLRRYMQYEKNINTNPEPAKQPTHRIAVDGIFNLYNSLAQHLRHTLSGPPLLSLMGTWEFTLTDSQNNKLFFVQAAAKDVFSLAPSAQLPSPTL